ncbi:1-acyl-sn-glycerol-3-phosphate acyltransferase [Profundibacter amoris]|uniref:Glycerol-3-phosphate acyltransferase n=1 Tax=Profundibacter amoris TaxID=2171755 RepID=A0A347UJW4_9RHOB|nr:1-acyl-sn-glycerol-3-phosphate acyltransferase [Profundibacter amoris]AXX99142.1 glycerol-3-phosphate acyltransferase [Profundibacter amoris]
MNRVIEVPLWILVLIVGFAAFAALERVLVPSVRWFFRRRMEKVVSRVNSKLDRPIEPFKLARRHDMIQRVIYDPKVAESIAEHARTEGVPENVAFEDARRYAKEIVPSFSASIYFGIAMRASRWLSRTLYRVRLGHFDEAAIEAIDKDATVIFVMNHRSNMDYVLVTYLAAERSALSYAVGEWAQVWPLKHLIRAMGAYFIRRKSRNPLYRRVLARYVQLATAGGVTQAVFPEGGLSLDGTVGTPKLGLLNYVVSDFDPEGARDVVFVPVALNYDRVLEDRVLMSAADAGNRKFRFSLFKMLGWIGRQIWFRITGRYHRFGYASVSFGDPVSLKEFVKTCPDNVTECVAEKVMERVREVVPVLPVPMVATVLLAAEEPMTGKEVVTQVNELANWLEANGAHIHVPRDSLDYAAEFGLTLLAKRRMLSEQDGQYSVNTEDKPALQYYANSIAHLIRRAQENSQG